MCKRLNHCVWTKDTEEETPFQLTIVERFRRCEFVEKQIRQTCPIQTTQIRSLISRLQLEVINREHSSLTLNWHCQPFVRWSTIALYSTWKQFELNIWFYDYLSPERKKKRRNYSNDMGYLRWETKRAHNRSDRKRTVDSRRYRRHWPDEENRWETHTGRTNSGRSRD